MPCQPEAHLCIIVDTLDMPKFVVCYLRNMIAVRLKELQSQVAIKRRHLPTDRALADFSN